MKKLYTLLFVLFVLNFKVLGSTEITTCLEYATGWTGSGIAEGINYRLDALYQEKRYIAIKDIKICEWGYGANVYIIYDVSNKPLNNGRTFVKYCYGMTGSSVAADTSTQLDLLYKKAKDQRKLLKIRDIKFTHDGLNGYIIYELSDLK